MIGDLLFKLQEAKRQIEESKRKLNDIIVLTDVGDGAIKVKANANKAIVSIDISDEFHSKADKEALEDMLMTAVNKALKEAALLGEAEMKEITKEMLPNFPGLF
jgi:DNA-binding YbaB/EbfC family protein